MTEKKGPNRIIILIVVGLMLVFFPVLSVYMSSSGLQAYKKMKAELKIYGDSIKIPYSALRSQSNEGISTEAFKGKVTIVQFYEKDCKACEESFSELKRVQSEFIEKARGRVAILSIPLNADSVQALVEQIKTMDIDTMTWTLATTDSSSIQKLVNQDYKMGGLDLNNHVALVDINGILVNHYDLKDKVQVNKMMEHIALLIPAKKDRKRIKFKQEKEQYK